MRKYRFFGSVFGSSSAGEVFAGENCTTPAPVILSMTLSDTEDDAAPRMTSAFASSSLSVWAPAMSGRAVTRVGLDLDDVLAEHAAGGVDVVDGGLRRRRTPAGRGTRGHRSAAAGCRSSGVPSPLAGGAGARRSGEDDAAAAGALLSLLLPQAVRASDAVASTTAARQGAVWANH